jgi:hypothetical protein
MWKDASVSLVSKKQFTCIDHEFPAGDLVYEIPNLLLSDLKKHVSLCQE